MFPRHTPLGTPWSGGTWTAAMPFWEHRVAMTERARPPGSKAVTSPLYRPDWKYVPGVPMEDLRRADWEVLESQRPTFYQENQADAIMRMFDTMREEPTFGYRVNNYQHCLQA